MSTYSIGVLVLSDTCAKDPSLDKTTPAVVEYIERFNDSASSEYTVTKKLIVPDSKTNIQAVIAQWTSEEVSLILTCGGTGFSPRDITPEAIEPLLEKKCPGIVQLMIQESLKITPLAIMSRPVVGIIQKSLIITLPGSPKGSVENLNIVLGSIEHALAQVKGDNSRALHKKMDRTLKNVLPGTASIEPHVHSHSHSHSHHDHHHHDHGHSHSHTHGGHGLAKHELISNDPSSITTRSRESPFPMIPVVDALRLISDETPAPTIIVKSVNEDLFGYIIAEDILSEVNVPNFRASIVDGYAVINTDCPGTYPVESISHASPVKAKLVLESGKIARITTGAPLPDGANAVIMVEETQLIESTEDGKEEKLVKILATAVVANDNIREVGSDVKQGDLILTKGTKISTIGGELGLLISCGIKSVKVYRKPIIGVLSTGDELMDINDQGQLAMGQIYDSNRPMLISRVRGLGYEVVDMGIVRDKVNQLEDTIRDGFEVKGIDYLITSGGVSMGELDLLKPIIERNLEGEIVFGRVAMKPGKPTTFAKVSSKGSTRLIFGLPGNPASANVTFNLFVLPSLLQRTGDEPRLPRLAMELTETTRLDARSEYRRVHVHQIQDGRLTYASTGGQRSSRVGSMKGANGLLVIPSATDVEGGFLEKGSRVEVILIDDIGVFY